METEWGDLHIPLHIKFINKKMVGTVITVISTVPCSITHEKTTESVMVVMSQQNSTASNRC